MFVFDRTRVSEEAHRQIEIMDSFHAVILIAPDGSANAPGAMWVENYHPLKSKFAFDITPVIPETASKNDALKRYQAIYDGLIEAPSTVAIPPRHVLKAA